MTTSRSHVLATSDQTHTILGIEALQTCWDLHDVPRLKDHVGLHFRGCQPRLLSVPFLCCATEPSWLGWGQPRQGGIDSPCETNEFQFIRRRDHVVFRLMHITHVIRSRNMRMFLGPEITLINQAHYMML